MSWRSLTKVSLAVMLAAILVVGMAALKTAAAPAGDLTQALANLGSRAVTADKLLVGADSSVGPPTDDSTENQTIAFDLPQSMRAQLNPGEEEEQLRDWLLVGVVSRLLPDPMDRRDALMDLPVARYGPQQQVSRFEYGPTRSRMLRDGVAVAILPSTADARARADDLAHVADSLRKDFGAPFKSVIVYEYTLDVAAAKADLHRLRPVSYADLFSPAYGYREATAKDAASLQGFLGQVDDLVSVSAQNDGSLLLGARKYATGQHLGINALDVAVLSKAPGKSDDPASAQLGFSLDPNPLYDKATDLLQRLDNIDWRDSASRKQWKAVTSECNPINYGGTLSPLYPPDKSKLHADISTAIDGLKKQDIVDFEKLYKSSHELESGYSGISSIIGCIHQESSQQSARYDGEIKGTEVGMTLFYTDLMAKLSTSNYLDSSFERGVPGFLNGYNFHLEKIYMAESNKYYQGRLWFNASTAGYSLRTSREGIFFDPVATRVYTAGSDPTSPGAEVQMSRVLDEPERWWNDHYAQVADYEPQYQRLNQIIKWSIVLSWLRDKYSSSFALTLDDSGAQRDLWFPDWAAKHSELRFHRWETLNFLPKTATETETLPIVLTVGPDPFADPGDGPDSKVSIGGGVSLASKEAASRLVEAPEALSPAARRAFFDYASDAASLASKDHGAFTLAKDAARVDVTPGPGLFRRGAAAELADEPASRVFGRGLFDDEIKVGFGDADVGVLHTMIRANGFRVGFRARTFEHAVDFAKSASAHLDADIGIAEEALRNPAVTATLRVGDRTFVRFGDSGTWVEFAADDLGEVNVPDGWSGRADAIGSDTPVRFRLTDPSEVLKLAKDPNQRLMFAPGPDHKVFIDVGTTDPGGKRVQISLNGVELSVTVNGDGAVSMRISDLPQASRDDPEKLFNTVDHDGLVQIAREAGYGGTIRIATDDLSAAAVAVRKALQGTDPGAVAQVAAKDPKAAAAMGRQYRRAIDRVDDLIRAKQNDAALEELDHLSALFGEKADLSVRRTLLRLNQGLVADAAAEGAGGLGQINNAETLKAAIEASSAAGDPRLRDAYTTLGNIVDAAKRRTGADGWFGPTLRADGSMDARLNFADELLARVVTSHDFAMAMNNKAAIFTDPSFAHLDWAAHPDRVLAYVVAHGGKLERLPAGAAADFRPSAVYIGDRHFDRVATINLEALHNIPPGAPQNCPQNHPCNDNNSSPGPYVYVARAA
jgi:hypothetical protein